MRKLEGSGLKILKDVSRKFRVVIDTKPLIKLFAKEEGWEIIREIFSKIEADKLEAGISVVTLTEIYYKYIQEKRQDLAIARTDQLKYALYLKKFNIDEDTAIKAGKFKGKYNISIVDAFIAASAHSHGAVVISDDPDFKRISEIETLTEEELYRRLQGK